VLGKTPAARRAGFAGAGDEVEVASRRGSVAVTVRMTESVMPGIVFAPFHFCASPINLLTNNALDPVAKTPEYKVTAVNLVKNANAEAAKNRAKECEVVPEQTP